MEWTAGAARGRRRPDRGGGGGDLSGAARVPGDADDRAAGGDAALGAVLAMFWAAEGSRSSSERRQGTGAENGPGLAARRRPFPAATLRRLAPAGVLLGALALVRPEYLASPSSWRWSCSRGELVAGGDARWPRPRSCSPASSSSSRRGRSATRSRSTASCRLDRRRPGPLRRHLPALRRQPGKGRRRGASPTTRQSSAPRTPERLRLEQILARLAAQRHPDLESDQALSRMGKRTALGRHHRRAARIRRLPRHQGRPDLVARPARRDARAGLGGAALGPGRLRPARPRSSSPGAAAGRRSLIGHGLPRRSPRSAPCWSPRPGASWC